MGWTELLEGQVTPELEEELARQAESLAVRVAESQARLIALREITAAAEAQYEADAAILRQLEGLLGRSQQLPLEALNPRLRGERLREVAVAILRQRAGEEPVHYRTWYQWVKDAGHVVSGKDPVASFLAAVVRLEGVERVGGARSGRYRFVTP